VYLVDDDCDIRRALRRMLRFDGHEVRTFLSGSSALEAVLTDPPDVVISDIYMPDGDGIELLIHLCDLESPVPVIAISGGGFLPGDLVLEDAGRLGAVATLEKPMSVESVREALTRALSADIGQSECDLSGSSS
jgi:DNA-binding NtrC family response regulator